MGFSKRYGNRLAASKAGAGAIGNVAGASDPAQLTQTRRLAWIIAAMTATARSRLHDLTPQVRPIEFRSIPQLRESVSHPRLQCVDDPPLQCLALAGFVFPGVPSVSELIPRHARNEVEMKMENDLTAGITGVLENI